MRALILFATACGFHGSPTEGPKDASPVGDGVMLDVPMPGLDGAVDARPIDARPIDARPIDAGLSMPDAMTDAKLGLSCTTSAPVPKACFLFEGNTNDSSGNSVPLLVTAGTPSYAPGQDSQAIALDAQDQLSITGTAANLVTSPLIAIKTYVKIPMLPAPGTRMGIIDNDAYRVFVMGGGTVRCAIGGNGSIKDETTTSGIVANTWTRIACTYDGITMLIYFNGIPQLTTAPTGSGGSVPDVTTSTEIAGNQGMASDQLVGYLDDFELFGTTLISP